MIEEAEGRTDADLADREGRARQGAPRVSIWAEQLLRLQRGGVVMNVDRDRPEEAGGVLNPASARSREGDLYLFPRLVAEGNYSRVGIAKVLFDTRGEPVGVERQGIVLEPETCYELKGPGHGGVEDPRITYLPLLDVYVMTYSGYGPEGPHVALATSTDLHTWRRLGLLRYDPLDGIDFGRCDNKDAVVFPLPVVDPEGRSAYAILHRPIYRVPIPGDGVEWLIPPGITDLRPSIWISYVPAERVHADLSALTHVGCHKLLAAPLSNWEHHHIGSGAPPILSEEGWILYYHGVVGFTTAGVNAPADRLIYQSGVMLLDRDDPRKILYRSATPVLLPDRPEERRGVVPNVVFPTAVDVRDSRVDVYYGAADDCISVATTHLSASALLGPSAPSATQASRTSDVPAHRDSVDAASARRPHRRDCTPADGGTDVKVSDIMTRDVQSVTPVTTLSEAAERMRVLGIGALPIEDEDEVVGVVTDRDMTVRAIAGGLDPRTATIGQVMTADVVYCFEDQTIEQAAELMAANRVRRLVVLDRARQLTGIISLDDVARSGAHVALAGETLEYTAERPEERNGRFERILVALDGSDFAERVLETAAPLAMRLGAQLILLRAVAHVPAPVGATTAASEPASAPKPRNGHGEVEAYLSRVQQRLEANGIAVRVECPQGPASEVIVRRARQLDADLIALSTHGRTGMDRVMMGSVAEDVLRRAPCPVLLVRALSAH